MGFFSLKATCAVCGKETGLNRVLLAKTQDKKEVWACAECEKKQKRSGSSWLIVGNKAFIVDNKATETRKKCETCGHIYCYTMADIERNKQHLKQAGLSSVAGMASALGGNAVASSVNTGNANASLNQVIDYTKCPKCNSTNVRTLSLDEWKAEKAKANNGGATVSSADELKKFKDLLDSGVITQEEFDAKKKQLLGL